MFRDWAPWTLGLMFAAAFGIVTSMICFKAAGDQIGTTRGAALWLAGIVVGFLYPMCMPVALSHNPPILVFTLVGGAGGVVGFLLLKWIFGEPMAWWQWVGVALTIVGTIMIQAEPVEADSVDSDSIETGLPGPDEKGPDSSLASST